MTLDDALLWLNDRLGKDVSACITLARGDLEVAVFAAEGELRHWSEAKAGARAAGRDDIAGLYDVGDAGSFDLSDLRPLEVTTSPDELTVQLDENTKLEVVEQET